MELAIQSISTSHISDNHLLHKILQQISHEYSTHSLTAHTSQNKMLFPNSSVAKMHNHKVNSFGPNQQVGFDIRARARTFHVSCERWCSCACHVQGSFRYPAWMRSVVGGLFVGYAGIPVFTPPCSETSCKQRSVPFIEVTYHFPTWLLSRVWSLNFRLSSHGGPELSLRMPRMVDWSTPLWKASTAGDIPAIQRLFASGKASPLDVNPFGQTALHVSA